MHGRVEGKTALITGGGSGLGREAAMHLAEEGANIVVSDLNEDTAQATADEINAQRQGAAVAARHDVSSEEDWADVLKTTNSQFGSLHILLNNAGISIHGPIEEVAFETWKQVQEVNVDSVFWGLFGSTTKTTYTPIDGFLYSEELGQVLITIVGFYFGNAAASRKT